MPRLRLLLSLMTSLLLLATQAWSAPTRSFSDFVDAFFDAAWAYSPSEATGTGIHRFDGQIEDRSQEAIQKRLVALQAFKKELEELKASALTFDEAIDAQALSGKIQGDIFEIETLRTWENNPMGYAGLPGSAIDVLIKRNFAPPEERLQKVIERLQGIPAIYRAAQANLKNPPRAFTDLAIRMAEGSVGYFKETLPGWARTAAGSDKALLARFTAANRGAIAATTSFASWLQKKLLPLSKGSFAIGAEAFATLLKNDEMVDEPLDKLLSRGEAQLKKDADAFLATARLIDPKKSPMEVMRLLSSEHPTAADLIPSVKRTLEEARAYLVAKDLITIPSDVRPQVEETPPYDRSGTFASMDTPGPEERKATEAFYYVTPVEKNWTPQHQEEHLRAYNPYVVAMINVHEAFPGHYIQFLYAPRYPTKTRRMVSSSSNAEGWAHYAEQMMVDEGFGQGHPKIRLAQLQEALLRDCRYIVGIKMHTQGWTVEQGAQFFQEHGYQEAANAFEEARRGAYNPTYLYYTLGKLAIQQLRDDYRQQTGASLKEFHDAFVGQGALPIPLVRKILFHGKDKKPNSQPVKS